MGKCECSCSCDKNSLEKILEKYEGKSTLLIPCLQDVQEYLGYISEEAVKKISTALKVAESEVYGVVSFYSQFRTTPAAKYSVDVCMGTACYVLGSGEVLETFCDKLKIKPGEISGDKNWMISSTRCLGCCGLAPVVTVNGKVYGKVKSGDVENIIKEYSNKAE